MLVERFSTVATDGQAGKLTADFDPGSNREMTPLFRRKALSLSVTGEHESPGSPNTDVMRTGLSNQLKSLIHLKTVRQNPESRFLDESIPRLWPEARVHPVDSPQFNGIAQRHRVYLDPDIILKNRFRDRGAIAPSREHRFQLRSVDDVSRRRS